MLQIMLNCLCLTDPMLERYVYRSNIKINFININ